MHRTVSLVSGPLLVVCSLLACEVVLRLMGVGPFPQPRGDGGGMHTPDPELGWRTKAGVYHVVNLATPDVTVRQTIWADGARATGSAQLDGADDLVLLGDSLVFGYGLNDEQTLGWKIQTRFRDLRVSNRGVNGYSPIQVLLLLREILKNNENSRPVVVYGFSDFDAVRSVAPVSWVRDLARISGVANVVLPSGVLEQGGQLRVDQSGRHSPQWPLRHHSVLVSLAEELYARIRWSIDIDNARAVSIAAIKEIANLANSHGAVFVVVFLNMGQVEQLTYERALGKVVHRTFSCEHPNGEEEAFRLVGDSHPNEIVNEYWAECLSAHLDVLLRSR